jgi:O-antigen/teichoic acid export membrane protein
VAFVTMVIKLSIVWPLVDRWGALGAGIAAAIAFTTQAALLYWRLSTHGSRPQMGLSLVPAAAGSVAMVPILLTGLSLISALMSAGLAFVLTWTTAARWLDPASLQRVSAIVRR